MRNFFTLTQPSWFNNRRVCLSRGHYRSDYRRAHFHYFHFECGGAGSWARGTKLSHRPIRQWAGRISLAFFTVICNSGKSQNALHPAFYSIPALPLAWFNTVVLIYAVCLLSAAPRCEGIYLPGILKTDFTEPSTSIGYWNGERLRLSTWLCRSHLLLFGWIQRA